MCNTPSRTRCCTPGYSAQAEPPCSHARGINRASPARYPLFVHTLLFSTSSLPLSFTLSLRLKRLHHLPFSDPHFAKADVSSSLRFVFPSFRRFKPAYRLGEYLHFLATVSPSPTSYRLATEAFSRSGSFRSRLSLDSSTIPARAGASSTLTDQDPPAFLHPRHLISSHPCSTSVELTPCLPAMSYYVPYAAWHACRF